MAADMPTCAEDGCESPGAFRTRTRPTWCEAHIREQFEDARVRLLDPFTGPQDHLLVECIDCGCQTHLRFEFLQGLLGSDRHGCGACRWREWAQKSRKLRNLGLGLIEDDPPVDIEAVRRLAENKSYEYLGPLTNPSLPEDPHHVRCQYCGRLSAERASDIGWGCSCRVNRKREKPETSTSKKKVINLFKDSNSPLVEWWAHDLNLVKDWETASVNATRSVWWRCPSCGLEFEEKVRDFVRGYIRCSHCEARQSAERRAEERVWANTKVSEIPELCAMWDDEIDPSTVAVHSDRFERYRFRCPKGHLWTDMPSSVLRGSCSRCSASETLRVNQELRALGDLEASLDPEIKAQWHPDLNGKLTPDKVGPNSRREIWWRDQTCGHEWVQSPSERQKRFRLLCPACDTKLGSLAAFYPELAEQWHPSNPLTPWHVLPTQKLSFVPKWVCPQNPEHTWEASSASRVNGSECPQCITSGKSRIELMLFEAIRALDPSAESGTPVRSHAFTRRMVWRPDVLAMNGTVAFEYDGSYWHAGKYEIDREKSCDLLAAGTAVFRVREHPLGPVGVEDPRYTEIFEYPETLDVDDVAQRFFDWAKQVTAARRR